MKKGFVFVETMVVIAFLGTVLLTVYSAFSTVIDNAKTRLYYDDPVYLYRTYYILNFFEENGLPAYIDLKFSNGLIINEISCHTTNLLLMDEAGVSRKEFCTKLTQDWNVKHIFIMKYNVNDIVECANKDGLSVKDLKECNRNNALRNLSIQGVNFLYSLDGYTGTFTTNYDDNKYRIVVEYGEDKNEKYDYYDYSTNTLNRNVNIKTTRYYYSSMEVPYGNLTDKRGVCVDRNRSMLGGRADTFGAYLDSNVPGTTTPIKNYIEKIELVVSSSKQGFQKVKNGYTDVSKHYNDRVRAKLSGKTLTIESLDELLSCDGVELFANMPNLKEIVNLKALDTRYITDMSSMFYNDRNLTKLDLSQFNTSNVTNMSSMFKNCSSLGSGSGGKLDLTSFDTSKVTTMNSMFMGQGVQNKDDPLADYSVNMSGLTEIVFGNKFVTSKVTNMATMFYKNQNLTKVNVENFDTSKVTNMSWMFAWSPKIQKLDLSKWNTKKVTSFKRMFAGNNNLTELKLGSQFTIDSATTLEGMFTSCSKIKELDLSSFANKTNVAIGGNPTAKKKEDYVPKNIKLWSNGMFAYTNNLTTINMENFDFTKITPATNIKAVVGETAYNNNQSMYNSANYSKWDNFMRNKGAIFYRSPAYSNKPTVTVNVKDCTQKCRLACYVANREGYYGLDGYQTTRINIVNKTGGTCNCASHICPNEFDDYS